MAKAEYRHCQALQSCRVVFSISVVMYRRQSLHFVAAAPDRWLAAGKTRFLLAILPRQQRQSITQRGHALCPVVALVSAPHHHCISLDVLHLQSVRTARLRYAQEPKSYIASASQVSVSHNSTTLRRSVGSAFGKQRSRASSPAHTRPLRADGMATSTTALVLAGHVASVSWQGGVRHTKVHGVGSLAHRAGRTAWYSLQLWHSHATGTGFAALRVYIGCCFVK